MLRHLLIFGICAAASASIPILLETRPGLLAGWTEAKTDAPEMVPVDAPRSPKSVTGRKAVVEADASGHFVAEFRINGRRVTGVVDTGATYVAMNASTARSLGIALKPANFSHEVNTANGKAMAAAAIIKTIEIGRVEARDVQAVVLEDRALDTTLIGMSFLRSLSKYEVSNGALLLVQ